MTYLGEAHSKGGWPNVATGSGLLDRAGFKKTSFYMFKSLWQDKPTLHITTQTLKKSPYILSKDGQLIEEDNEAWKKKLWEWHDVNTHWNYEEGEDIVVEIYSNLPQMELYLNNLSLGRKSLKDFEDRIYKWHLSYEEGKLEAKTMDEKGEIIQRHYESAGEIRDIELIYDKLQKYSQQIESQEPEILHIMAQFVDEKGIAVKHMDQDISFSIEGNAYILGIDNGYIQNIQPHQSHKITTYQGRCLLIVQLSGRGKDIKITAESLNISQSIIYKS